MNLIAFFDIISTVGFGAALLAVFFMGRKRFDLQARTILALLLFIYFLVGLSNILEHAGITDYFDRYEDYLEILFMPFFLFFLFSVYAKLNLDKRLAAENTLRSTLDRAESEHSKLNAILAAIGDGISIQDRDLKVLYQNEIHKKMVGDHAGEYCYQAYEHSPEPCHGCPVLASFHDSKVHKGERSAPTDKGTLYVEITASPLINQEGKVYAGIEVVRDITNRKRMTEEILRAQKLESIGLLAGGIAHDFNNLLTALLGNVSLAKTYAEADGKIVAKLEAAEKASLRARELTQQLLTFSRGGAPVKKVMNVNELVHDSSMFSLRGANVSCKFVLSGDLWPVEVDPGQLSQVVNNLIINADQAMPEGGLINISTENTLLTSGNPMLLSPGKYVRIVFADQGHGIKAEDLPMIFDPFYTTKQEGSGLGLATAFSIIKNHRGLITVESSGGDGAKFSVYIPATEAQPEESATQANTIFKGGGRVLIMDDDEAIRALAREMLVHLGYSVISASNGEEALEIYRTAIQDNNPFAAVILDLTVPGGMGGKEAGRNILDLDPAAKVMVSSGYANDPIMAYYENYGFSGILPKPYKIQEMSEKLYGILGAAAKGQ